MKSHFILPFIIIINYNCSTTHNIPAIINIDEVRFQVNPYILHRNGDFYLVYQVDIDEPEPNVRLQIGERKANNKFYYFFIGGSSFPEYQDMVFRPVKKSDDIINLFKTDSVFWLNADKTEIKLKIVNE